MPSAADTRAVWQALSIAPDAERAAWRWRLARDYAARGLYAEADGVLRALAADTPERADTRAYRLLHAEVLTAIGEAEAALTLLDSPSLEGAPETCLRRLSASSEAPAARSRSRQSRLRRSGAEAPFRRHADAIPYGGGPLRNGARR